MEAKSTRKRWTYAEFARLPESGGMGYEIIDDELYVTPSTSVRHQPAPVVLGVADVFGWRPVAGGPELELPLAELFRGA